MERTSYSLKGDDDDDDDDEDDDDDDDDVRFALDPLIELQFSALTH